MNTIDPPARIAFIGMGVMGAAMAANIRKAGFALTVATRSRDKAEALLAAGARWAASAAEAAQGAACVALCVPDTPDVEAVLFGPGGVAEGIAPGTLVIDFSTIAASAPPASPRAWPITAWRCWTARSAAARKAPSTAR